MGKMDYPRLCAKKSHFCRIILCAYEPFKTNDIYQGAEMKTILIIETISI